MTEGRKPVIDAGFKLLNLTHKTVLRATGGRWPTMLFGMPGVELQTIGRKSGSRARPCSPRRSTTTPGSSWWPPRAATTATPSGTAT